MTAMTFEEIKAAVSIEQAIQMLGLQLKRKGFQLRGLCPACKGGGDHPLAITLEGYYKGTFRCFVANQSGDCIGLVAHALGIKQGDAAEKIKRHFGLNSSDTAP